MARPSKIFEDDHQRPLPQVQAFDKATVTTEQLVAALAEAGGCIVKNAVPSTDLALIEKDVRPWLDADKPWAGDFFPIQTRRVNGLAEKSKVFMDKIVCNEAYQDVCTEMLTSTTKNYLGQEMHTSVSRPQLSNTIVFSIGSGASAQPLHRDDMVHHRVSKQMRAEDYVVGQDTAIGFFVGGKKTTKANGATRFIPGSHLWDQDTPPNEDLSFYAELNPGDAFIMLASCYHGGSANTTENEERLVYSCFMTKGYLRQEENQYLNNDRAKIAKLYDDEMLKLVGYSLSAPFLGWIKEGHPLAALDRPQPLGDMY